jgi:hypothetical protein
MAESEMEAGLLPDSWFLFADWVFVRNLQIANQPELQIHAHLSSHLIRITLSVPIPKAAAPFLREK